MTQLLLAGILCAMLLISEEGRYLLKMIKLGLIIVAYVATWLGFAGFIVFLIYNSWPVSQWLVYATVAMIAWPHVRKFWTTGWAPEPPPL